MIDQRTGLLYAAMENFNELTDRKEVLKEEIKGLKKDIREMKRELKIKMEEFNEINKELRDLENQDDDKNNLISSNHALILLE